MQALAVAASVQRQRGNLPSEHYSLPLGLTGRMSVEVPLGLQGADS